jgi:hypothetical protein
VKEKPEELRAALEKLERENRTLKILAYQLKAKIEHMQEYPFLPAP